MIHGSDITFSYEYEGSENCALRDVELHIHAGEFAVLLGKNGSGKSTLCRHINALLPLQSGALQVAGIDAGDPSQIWRLRRKVGMVFQNPDNQFVSSVLEEDVAFGLENYQTPREELPRRVDEALQAVGLVGFGKRALHTLSGGQKQRAALAGVLALTPEILVFDEATAMLDPQGRQEILSAMHRLHRQGATILMVTHYVEEAVDADRVFLMADGSILANGTPQQVLTDSALLRQAGLLPTTAVQLYEDLKRAGIVLPHCPLTDEALAEEVCQFQQNTSA